jgi:sulfur-carrier protein adenylyltransferase/sulfurtransferase
MERFTRQIILKGFGFTAQSRLRKSAVLVVGAGGLGCPALQYLAAAGVGRIGIIDGDAVSLSNLNRQILFGINDVGKNKASMAASKLSLQYQDINWDVYEEFLQADWALKIFPEYDLILDATDNFPVRYLINDVCVLLGKSFIMGAIFRNEGQMAVFNYPPGRESINYRDLFPFPPNPNEVPTCNENGVLGSLTGIIGSMQASEAIKILSGYGPVNGGRLFCYDMFTHALNGFQIGKNRDANAHIPVSESQLLQKEYGAQNCAVVKETTWEQLGSTSAQNSIILDVREVGEEPEYPGEALKIPLSELLQRIEELSTFHIVYCFCQSGIRSKKAVETILFRYPEKLCFNILGGLLDYRSTR